MKQPMKSALTIGTGVIVATGFVLAPAVASAANSPASTTINANIASTISISTSGTVTLAITPTGSGSASSASDTVTVNTNNALGYKLQLANASATVGTLANGGNSLATASGTFASPAALGNNTWGYRVDGVGTFGAGPTSAQTNAASLTGLWAKVPLSASPDQLKNTSTTATNDTTTVWYGAMADTTKPNGTYAGTVTYTATTN